MSDIRAEVLAEIEAARPEGYFDSVRGLLDQLVDLRVEVLGLWPRLHALRPGTVESFTLTLALADKMKAVAELCDVLHLFDRGLPPPRLQ